MHANLPAWRTKEHLKTYRHNLCIKTDKYIRICIDTHVYTYILTRNMHAFFVRVRVLLIVHSVWFVLGALRSQKNMFYIFALSSAQLGLAKASLFQDYRASLQKWPHTEVFFAPSIYPLHIFSVITVPVSAVLEFFITTIFLGENKKRPSLRVFSWFLICSNFSNYAHECIHTCSCI